MCVFSTSAVCLCYLLLWSFLVSIMRFSAWLAFARSRVCVWWHKCVMVQFQYTGTILMCRWYASRYSPNWISVVHLTGHARDARSQMRKVSNYTHIHTHTNANHIDRLSICIFILHNEWYSAKLGPTTLIFPFCNAIYVCILDEASYSHPCYIFTQVSLFFLKMNRVWMFPNSVLL